ncbi:hypothetical protein BC830DRAFT_86684 [Chytriomyces sp. MP71]|nr:hypothetical protein BC830DRAFT_86684 [Chytriomyces sp. MP71]
MRYAIFTYILIIFVYCAIIQGLSPRVSIYPLVQDCYFDLQQYGLCIFSVLIIFIFGGIFATWLVHDIQDHSFIAKELIITYSIGAPMAVLYLLFHTIPFLGTLSFDSNWLVTIDLNLKSFQEALGDRLLFEDIKKFAIRDMCGENFYFLEAMRDLKQEAALLVLRQKTRSVTAADYGAMHERMMSVSLTVLRSGNRASHFGQIRKLSLSKDSPAGVIREEASSISETNEVKIRVDVCEEKEEEEEEEGSENNNANVRTVEDSFGINGRPARRSISSETRASILSANDYLKPRESSIGSHQT